MAKPKTQKEQIDQLWMKVIGTNGDGIMLDIKEIKENVSELKDKFIDFLISREKTCPVANRKYKNMPLWIAGISAFIAAMAVVVNLVV